MSLPSKLVEQRPDVCQAEENLHAASALIGVAIANRLPSITLGADGGSSPHQQFGPALPGLCEIRPRTLGELMS